MNSPFDRGRPLVWRESDGVNLLPKAAGAYRFIQPDSGVADYIGITSNLYNRVVSHRSSGHYFKSGIHQVNYQVALNDHDWDQLRAWEIRKISDHNPTFNKTVGGNGRVSRIYLDGQSVEIAKGESVEDAVESAGLLSWILGVFRS